jgi:acyl carrier protein
MTDQDILDTFSRILRDLLSDDSIVLEMETTRGDVEGWDSLNYVNFIVSVEMEFGVSFNVSEVESFDNVGTIVRQIQALSP